MTAVPTHPAAAQPVVRAIIGTAGDRPDDTLRGIGRIEPVRRPIGVIRAGAVAGFAEHMAELDPDRESQHLSKKTSNGESRARRF